MNGEEVRDVENVEHHEFDHEGLRETVLFTLTSGYLFGCDTVYLPTSAGGDGQMRLASRWPIAVACAIWLAIFAYVGMTN